MNPTCPEVRARFLEYVDDTLASPERGVVRDHLALCGPCREEAALADATLMFASGAPPVEVSAADMARILQGVRAGVAIKRAERRLAKPPRRAAAVAAAAAVALLTLALPGGPQRDALNARQGEPAVRVATPAAGPVLAKAAGAPADAGGSTVYEIAPGAGPDEPRVVWIVDRSLDI
jgi:anti-sigma factor RsiW